MAAGVSVFAAILYFGKGAALQNRNNDGSLTLGRTNGLDDDDTTGVMPGGQPGEKQDPR